MGLHENHHEKILSKILEHAARDMTELTELFFFLMRLRRFQGGAQRGYNNNMAMVVTKLNMTELVEALKYCRNSSPMTN